MWSNITVQVSFGNNFIDNEEFGDVSCELTPSGDSILFRSILTDLETKIGMDLEFYNISYYNPDRNLFIYCGSYSKMVPNFSIPQSCLLEGYLLKLRVRAFPNAIGGAVAQPALNRVSSFESSSQSSSRFTTGGPTAPKSELNTNESDMFDEGATHSDFLSEILEKGGNNGSNKKQNNNAYEPRPTTIKKAASGSSTDKKQPQKRGPKDKPIREVIRLVEQWRGACRDKINGKGLTLAESAKVMGIPKKTLDDYFMVLKQAKCLNFDINTNLDELFGVIRTFLRKHKAQKAAAINNSSNTQKSAYDDEYDVDQNDENDLSFLEDARLKVSKKSKKIGF
jgi:hypothetical protein